MDKKLKNTFFNSKFYFFPKRVKCLSDLAELQQSGRSATQLAHLAAVTSTERNRLKQVSTLKTGFSTSLMLKLNKLDCFAPRVT
jgi:hypothetical protein